MAQECDCSWCIRFLSVCFCIGPESRPGRKEEPGGDLWDVRSGGGNSVHPVLCSPRVWKSNVGSGVSDTGGLGGTGIACHAFHALRGQKKSHRALQLCPGDSAVYDNLFLQRLADSDDERINDPGDGRPAEASGQMRNHTGRPYCDRPGVPDRYLRPEAETGTAD